MSTQRKSGRGGARPGSGPKPKPRREVRRHRVVVMLNDADLAALKKIAKRDGNPLGTAAHKIVVRTLRRGRK